MRWVAAFCAAKQNDLQIANWKIKKKKYCVYQQYVKINLGEKNNKISFKQQIFFCSKSELVYKRKKISWVHVGWTTIFLLWLNGIESEMKKYSN